MPEHRAGRMHVRGGARTMVTEHGSRAGRVTMAEVVRRAAPSPVVADAVFGGCVAVGVLAVAFAGVDPS
ncbi:MAG: hypothetical protein ACRDQ0_19875, partial [Pseudonocardia sp.]